MMQGSSSYGAHNNIVFGLIIITYGANRVSVVPLDRITRSLSVGVDIKLYGWHAREGAAVEDEESYLIIKLENPSNK